jgi:hypothetical protein
MRIPRVSEAPPNSARLARLAVPDGEEKHARPILTGRVLKNENEKASAREGAISLTGILEHIFYFMCRGLQSSTQSGSSRSRGG